MRRWIFAAVFALLIAAPAWAADTNKYPFTLMDQTCTDDYNVPAAYTPGLTRFGGPVPAASLLTQTSGTGDGFCDNDSRILTAAQTADVIFGPFDGANLGGVLVMVDADTVLGGTPTWLVELGVYKAFDGAFQAYDRQAASISGTGDKVYLFGGGSQRQASVVTEVMDAPLPNPFYIRLRLVSATSITADMSLSPIGKW